MAYKIDVMPVDNRREIIKTRTDDAENKHETQDFFAYSQQLALPIISLPIELPLYRLNNARTRSWQLSYSEEHEGLPESFFRDHENLAAQKVQHDQLVELAKKGKTEEPSIWDVFEDEKRQTEPLILTSSGVVLNGNRRLAAMRELVGAIPSFQNIRTAILPSWLREPDMLEIEARLQVAPDVRLPYVWTDEALLILSMREAGMNDERIATILRKTGSEMEILLERFNEGKLFLAEGLKEPTNFAALAPHEQNFTELTKAIKKASADEKDVSRLICNTITKHHKDTTRRLYDYRVMYGKDRVTVLHEFARRKNIPLPSNGDGVSMMVQPQSPEDEDLFDDASEASPDDISLAVKYAPVIAALKDESESAANAALLRQIGDDIIENKSDDKARSLALRKLERARLLLDQISLDRVDPETFPEIRNKLTDVKEAADRLIATLGRIEGNG